MNDATTISPPQLSIHCGILQPTTTGYKLVTDSDEYKLEIPRYLQTLLPRHAWDKTFIKGASARDGTIRVKSIWTDLDKPMSEHTFKL